MPFLLAGSPNDVKSGDLKIKEGTSNVLDPMIKFVHFYESIFDFELGLYVIKEPKSELEKLKNYVLKGFMPILVFHDSGSDLIIYYPLNAISTNGDWLQVFPSDDNNIKENKNIAYFGDFNAMVLGYFDFICFNMDLLEIRIAVITLGSHPNDITSIKISDSKSARNMAINRLKNLKMSLEQQE